MGRMLVAMTLGALLTGILGCTVEPAAYPIVGPDGSRMLHVSCGAEEGRCFQLAGENCPLGYDIYAVHPPSGESFLVRCHYAAASAPPSTEGWQASSYRSASPTSSAPPASPMRSAPNRDANQWPPAGEPDTVPPWPPAGAKPTPSPASSAPGASTAGPMSGLPGSPDDLGY